MKRFVATLFVLMLIPGLADARIYADAPSDAPSWGVVPGVVIIKLKPDVTPRISHSAGAAVATGLPVLDAVAADMRARSLGKVFRASRKPAAGSPLDDLTRYYRLEFDVVRDPALVAEAIAADPNVELAEVVTWHAVNQFIPNDPNFDDQWHHMEGTQPTQDNDIDSPEAWEVQTGDPDVVVAIFDTGVLWYHPDLINQIWVNPGEDLDGDGVVMDPGDMNGIDDDGNGKIDDLIGWDFVTTASGCQPGEDCGVQDNDPRDYNGHGTHVAGIVAAATNNGTGGAGVAGGRYPLQRGCLIMPCRAGWETTDGRGAVRTDFVGEGVNYAVANGALVGNLSAGAGASSVLASALVNAFANGFIFTKSAGNDNQSIPDDFDNFQTTVAVAATTTSDTKASFSDYGTWVDISAPGVNIYSTYGGGGTPAYAYLDGTSMAAPVVAGVAALIYANNPSFTKAEVEATLMGTADDISALNPGYEFFLGSGRVNAGNAMASLPQAAFGAEVVLPPAAPSGAATAAALAPDTPLVGSLPFTVQFTDLSPGPPTAWLWDFGDGNTSPDQNPQHTYTAGGVYDVRLDATHPGGEGRKRHQNAVVAHADSLDYLNGKNCSGVGKKAEVVLNLTNELDVHQLILPLTYQGPGDKTLDSFSFADTRIEYFEDLDDPFSSSSNKFKVFKLTADVGGGSPPLAPGTGPILKLWFTMEEEAPDDTLSPVDTFTVLNYRLKATTKNGIAYVPGWEVGGITLLSYCRGDFNLDGAINSSDIILEVNYVFKSGPESADPWTMDANRDGAVTAGDVIFLVNHVFKGGDPPE